MAPTKSVQSADTTKVKKVTTHLVKSGKTKKPKKMDASSSTAIVPYKKTTLALIEKGKNPSLCMPIVSRLVRRSVLGKINMNAKIKDHVTKLFAEAAANICREVTYIIPTRDRARIDAEVIALAAKAAGYDV